jgi:hypothetical protein
MVEKEICQHEKRAKLKTPEYSPVKYHWSKDWAREGDARYFPRTSIATNTEDAPQIFWGGII